MPDVREVFRMATQNARPAPGALERQLEQQRRQVRNRKAAALAMVAVIMAAIALFAGVALNRGKEGSAPAVPHGGSVPTFTTVGLDGSGFRILTNDPIAAKQPRWSPDGSQLLYFRKGADGNLRLMVMNADGTNVREIPGTHQTADFNPADWSPDGSLILYTSFQDGLPILATLPVAGGRTHFLNKGSGSPQVGGAWSPDGSSIAFTRGVGSVFQVWGMNADGSGEHLLAALPDFQNAEAPAWSPDGSKIAFIGTVNGVYGSGGTLFVLDVATGDITEVLRGTATGRRHENRPNWLPDGNTVLVMTEAL